MATIGFVNNDTVRPVPGDIVRSSGEDLGGVLVLADSAAHADKIVGVWADNPLPGYTGQLNTDDIVEVNCTEAVNPGDRLYVSAVTKGKVTKTAPSIPISIGVAMSTRTDNGAYKAKVQLNAGATDLTVAARSTAENLAAQQAAGQTDLVTPANRTTLQALAGAQTNILTVASGARRRMPRRLGRLELITSFAGWTPSTSGTSTVTLADATDSYGSGATCAVLHTDGANGTCQMSSPVLSDTINLTNGVLLVALKFANAAALSTTPMTIYAGSDASTTFTNYVTWGLASFGGVSNSRYNQPDGAWLLIPLPLSNLSGTFGAPNLAAIDHLRIKLASSAGAPTDVKVGAVLLAKNSYAKYANGAIVLTFDDCRSGQYKYRELLNQRGIQGTYYIVDEYLGSDAVNYMTLAQVQQLRAEGHIIGYHAATSAAHAARYPALGATAAVSDLTASFANHAAWGLETEGEPKHFAWPGGEWDNATWAAISALGLTSMRLTGGTAAKLETYPPVDKNKIIAGSSTGSLTSLALRQAWAAAVKTYKLIGVLAEHQVYEGVTGANGVNYKELETFLDYVISEGIALISVAELTE